MKISEAAETCGLSAHTIRYYEKSGMLPGIERGTDGHRNFSRENLDWLNLLSSLRETGMSLVTMKRFAHLYDQGNTTVTQRKQMLRDHEKQLKARQSELMKCRKILALKIARYDEILGEQS